MSELINNQTKRREDLLKFSRGMIEGENGRELIDRYREAIQNVTPEDLLIVEDKQVKMGISPARVKEHIEKILNVIGPYLEKYQWSAPAEGHPLYYMMKENRRLEELLGEMKKPIKRIELSGPDQDSSGGQLDKSKEIKKLQEQLEHLTRFNRHYLRKENILFPYLERKWDFTQPLQVMWSLHDDIRKMWDRLQGLLAEHSEFNQDIRYGFGRLFSLMYRMVFKEEKILFPVALEALSAEEWREVGAQSEEIGYAFIEPVSRPSDRKSDSESPLQDIDLKGENLSAGQVLLGFGTGALNLNQLTTMLNALPVDITYVDQTDTVKYFSRPEKRIFPRTPAVIGRKVQYCHPPESVDKVEQILNSFKRGEKDQARFWIKIRDKFILIEYFALRNGGEYLGTLEVSQDITEIRELEGEKRLLDWEK